MEKILNLLNIANTAIPKEKKLITTSLAKATWYLKKGDPVAIPTETVYGLAANIYDENAVKKIFEIKKRPAFNPLIVHVASIDSMKEVAVNIPPIAYTLAEKFWPGPLTLILEKKSTILDCITAGKKTVAVRMPNHKMTLELIKRVGFPLAAPSANPFGSISPTSAQHVANYFKKELNVVLDGGECEKGIESTIVGFENGKVILYRLGVISKEMIEFVVGEVELLNIDDNQPKAPGMLLKHYAPKTKMIMSEHPFKRANDMLGSKIGLLIFGNEKFTDSRYTVKNLSENGDVAEAAKNLYAHMHLLDEMGLELIIAQKFPDAGIGKSINDRLSRACWSEMNYTSTNIFSE